MGLIVSTFQAPSPIRITKYCCVGSNWFLEPDPTEICHQTHQTGTNPLGGYRAQLNKGETHHSVGAIGPNLTLATSSISAVQLPQTGHPCITQHFHYPNDSCAEHSLKKDAETAFAKD